MENALILLYDVCRLCLDEPGVDNIFKPIDWSEDIFTYTGVKVQQNDKLPQTICPSCRDIMNCAKVLREVAERNNNRLMSLMASDAVSDTQVDQLPSMYIMLSRVPSSKFYQTKSSHSSDLSSANDTVRSTFFENEKCKKPFALSPKSEVCKANAKRRPSKSGSIGGTPKLISVRKDLFDSPQKVSSSTKKREAPSSSKESEKKTRSDEQNCDVSPVKKSETSPTSSKDVKKQKTDTDEHKCETCKKTYATSKKLYLHQLSHNKKFCCPIDMCPKRFATKGDLQKHVRSHTGERPFKCDLCDQSFTQNVSLKAHKDNIHVEQHR